MTDTPRTLNNLTSLNDFLNEEGINEEVTTRAKERIATMTDTRDGLTAEGLEELEGICAANEMGWEPDGASALFSVQSVRALIVAAREADTLRAALQAAEAREAVLLAGSIGWVRAAFGGYDQPIDRVLRLGEEVRELEQTEGVTREEAHALVDQVHDRAADPSPRAEFQGVMFCAAAYAASRGFSMLDAAETELGRVNTPEVLERARRKVAQRAIVMRAALTQEATNHAARIYPGGRTKAEWEVVGRASAEFAAHLPED